MHIARMLVACVFYQGLGFLFISPLSLRDGHLQVKIAVLSWVVLPSMAPAPSPKFGGWH